MLPHVCKYYVVKQDQITQIHTRFVMYSGRIATFFASLNVCIHVVLFD